MKTIFFRLTCVALCSTLFGCAGMNPIELVRNMKPSPTLLTAEQNTQGVKVGQSKAEVVAQLGSTRTVVFDSGFEVWVYQTQAEHKSDASWLKRIGHTMNGQGSYGTAEFIVLFGPEGIVRKTRLWQPPPPADKKI